MGSMTRYQYDGLGRLTAVASPGGTLGYAYDRDGNRTSLAYPGGQTVASSYSPGGRLVRVADWAGRASTYSYRPSGLVASLAYPNGVLETFSYDAAQRLSALSYSRSGVILSQLLTLDGEGNRRAIEESATVQSASGPRTVTDRFTLAYDGLSRLTAQSAALFSGATRSESFAFDPASNITARTGPSATFTHDGANRVTSDGVRSFVWSPADRLTQRGADTFSYDPLGRLTASTVGSVSRTYAYDGDGLLARRTQGASVTSFLWDVASAPAALLQAGTDRLVHGLGPRRRLDAHPHPRRAGQRASGAR